MTIHSRARGCILGHMIGDALGAAVEGRSRDGIRELCRSIWGSPLVEDFILAVPMGTYVPAGPEEGPAGTYREAREADDWDFVPPGPPSDEGVKRQCARRGCYTDDTAACLALGSSIADRGGVRPSHAARRCAEFFRDNERYRGCPPTAKALMKATLEGVPVEKIGLPPYFPFEGGSFANGGAMRISLLPVAYRNADASVLRRSVESAVMGSHRHPEAVDFAAVQAAAVQFALNVHSWAFFDPLELLETVEWQCRSTAMRDMIKATKAAFIEATKQGGELDHDSDFATVRGLIQQTPRPGSGYSFQIASIHMMPCVLWCVCRHYRDPRRAIQAAIDLGGDTDTTACMVGAIVGALHGEGSWCTGWAASLENGPHGRDYALRLAEELVDLDLT